jgi:hypothetical protein
MRDAACVGKTISPRRHKEHKEEGRGSPRRARRARRWYGAGAGAGAVMQGGVCDNHVQQYISAGFCAFFRVRGTAAPAHGCPAPVQRFPAPAQTFRAQAQEDFAPGQIAPARGQNVAGRAQCFGARGMCGIAARRHTHAPCLLPCPPRSLVRLFARSLFPPACLLTPPPPACGAWGRSRRSRRAGASCSGT